MTGRPIPVTGGQGSFVMELSHYDPVPPQVQQQIAAAYAPKAEEEGRACDRLAARLAA